VKHISKDTKAKVYSSQDETRIFRFREKEPHEWVKGLQANYTDIQKTGLCGNGIGSLDKGLEAK
jgi:hypothetical protein